MSVLNFIAIHTIAVERHHVNDSGGQTITRLTLPSLDSCMLLAVLKLYRNSFDGFDAEVTCDKVLFNPNPALSPQVQ